MIEPKTLATGTADMIAIGALVVVVVVVFFTLQAGNASQTRVRDRIGKLQKRYSKKNMNILTETTSTLRRHISEEPGGLIGVLLKFLPSPERLQQKLERAERPNPNAKLFLLRCLLTCLVIMLGVWLAGKPLLVALALGFVVGFWIPLKLLDRTIQKKMNHFLKVFPDGIDLIVRGLRSGLPVADSFVMVAQEVPDPVGKVFKVMVDKMKLGVPMEQALQETAQGLGNTEFNFFTTSIILQRETGGNLGEILSNLSEILRKRYMMKMKITAMTSEARASAWIVGSLPFLVSLAVMFMSPGYLSVLINDARGTKALIVACCMMWFGIWSMKRMGRFEI